MKKYEKRIFILLSIIIFSSCASQNRKQNSTQSIAEPSKSYVETSKTVNNKSETGYGTYVAPKSYSNGFGHGSEYSLKGRKAISKTIPKYICNEEGIIVVDVTVDQNGKTISATAGVKGTTNTASCLLEQAKIAALNTKWSADSNAAAKQVGKIIYNFSLEENTDLQ